MNLLPLLLNLAVPLQRSRPLLASSQGEAGEPGWRRAYQRLREDDQPLGDGAAPALLLPMPQPQPVALAPVEAATPSVRGPRRAPLREVEAPVVEPAMPRPVPTASQPEPEPEPAPAALPVEATVAAARIAALRALPEPGPVRVWQVELPLAGPTWHLQLAQAHPQAPLELALRVPAVAQSQAREQLVDLDRRLREAGHDVQRARLRTPRRPGPPLPIEEVTS